MVSYSSSHYTPFGNSTLNWGDEADGFRSPISHEGWKQARSPGDTVLLHEKLSSPLRKRPVTESARIGEERQAKAQQVCACACVRVSVSVCGVCVSM